MKILFNTYQGAFQNPGGGELIIRKLHHHLSSQGVHVDLFDQWQHKFSDYDIIHHFSLYEWEIWDHYRSENVSIAVTPTFWCNDSKTSLLHNKVKHVAKKLIRRHQHTLRTAMSIPDIFFPTTSLEMDKIKNYFDINPSYEVIPNGIEKPILLSDDYPTEKPQYDYLLFVGNITPIKNLHKIIKAAKEVGTHLHIVGNSPAYHGQYYDYCHSLANDKIHFKGKIDNDSPLLAQEYENSQGLIVASKFETCSIVGLEAGSYAKPLAITKLGGTTEVFANHAIFLDPTSHKSITDAMRQMLAMKGKNEALQKHILDNYTWDQIAEKLSRSYEKLIKSKRR